MVFSKSINVITLRPICSVMETLVRFFSQKCLPSGSVTHQQHPADLVLTYYASHRALRCRGHRGVAAELGSTPVCRPHPPFAGFWEMSALPMAPPQPPLHLGPGGDNLWPSPFWISEECPLVPYIRNTDYLLYISPGSSKYFEDGFRFPLSCTNRSGAMFHSY